MEEEKWADFLVEEIPMPKELGGAAGEGGGTGEERSTEAEGMGSGGDGGGNEGGDGGGNEGGDGGGDGGGERPTTKRPSWASVGNKVILSNQVVRQVSALVAERRLQRERGDLPTPKARHVALVPDDIKLPRNAGISAEEIEAETRARTGGDTAAAAAGTSSVKEVAVDSPGAALGRAAAAYVKSAEGTRMVLSLLSLVLLFALRYRRGGQVDPYVQYYFSGVENSELANLTGLVQAGDETDAACRWDWRVPGCIAAAPGVLADGVVCALRPLILRGQMLRCRPVASSSYHAPGGHLHTDCPSHCQARLPRDSCKAAVAAVLYRVAHGLRAECALDGTCPKDERSHAVRRSGMSAPQEGQKLLSAKEAP